MASGNEGNEERRRSHGWPDVCPCVPAEGRVAEEAEEVFRSYAFYRYQQERQECGAELPPDPEIEAWPDSPCPPSTGSQVGQRLAIIGDDIYRRYDAEFRTMLESLQPTRHNAYETFTNIASRGGQVWSVLLVKPTLCLSFTLQPSSFPGLFLCFLPVCTAPIIVPSQAQWGPSEDAVQNLDNVYVKYLLVVAAVVVLGHLVLRRFFTP
uniref:Uncharacterized protein n=1 Tax=Junco hyemalis TaxID=40217 RepID=A0A8C5JIX3_JUNHY